jgi:hypothetical protein
MPAEQATHAEAIGYLAQALKLIKLTARYELGVLMTLNVSHALVRHRSSVFWRARESPEVGELFLIANHSGTIPGNFDRDLEFRPV